MGLINDKICYTYDDVTIMPCRISDIEHRSECIPYDENGMLPLFTAPMNTVVGIDNFDKFQKEKIYPILPRTEDIRTRLTFSFEEDKWAAYSLSEFEEYFCKEENKRITDKRIRVLIDIANGHMKKILDLVKIAKSMYGDKLIIMAGNIANPNTYEDYAEVGIDFVRCSIGTGNGCLSSSNLGVHVPIVSLIDDIVNVRNRISNSYAKLPKIVADGGIRNYRDIIKALALGADYVMVGSVFAKMLESSASKKCTSLDWVTLPYDLKFEELDLNAIYKEDGDWYATYNSETIFLGDIIATFYGMASREGQIALNGSKTKTSEGILKELKVEYTMNGWVTNLTDYLRSAMSYVGVRTLDDFRKNSTLMINSPNAVSAVNK